MGTRKTAESKNAYIQAAIYKANEEGIVINENQLIADFCLHFNATLATAKSYIQIYLNAQRIKRTIDGLVPL
jgi:hypothetical protein